MSYAPSIIKSIQFVDAAINNGSSTGSGAISSPVNPDKAFPVFLGATISSGDAATGGRATSWDANSVDVARTGTTGDTVLSFAVVEFY